MSTQAQTGWNLERLGRWSEPLTFTVTRDRIAAYAAATNDEHPAHRSGELAPPVFPVVGALTESLAPALMAVIPRELAMRILHGEQDFRYHQPIRPGQVLKIRSAALGVRGVSTGAVILGRATTETDGGELLVEQDTALFVRGGALNADAGEHLAAHAFPPELRDTEPAARVTQTFDPGQTRRYADASGDMMAIHLDDDVARSVGLPGIIVHGLCTMAYAGRVVVAHACDDDPGRLRRLAVRFAGMVRPSETITTSLYDAGAGRWAFETVSDTGNTVVKDGLAEVR